MRCVTYLLAIVKGVLNFGTLLTAAIPALSAQLIKNNMLF